MRQKVIRQFLGEYKSDDGEERSKLIPTSQSSYVATDVAPTNSLPISNTIHNPSSTQEPQNLSQQRHEQDDERPLSTSTQIQANTLVSSGNNELHDGNGIAQDQQIRQPHIPVTELEQQHVNRVNNIDIEKASHTNHQDQKQNGEMHPSVQTRDDDQSAQQSRPEVVDISREGIESEQILSSVHMNQQQEDINHQDTQNVVVGGEITKEDQQQHITTHIEPSEHAHSISKTTDEIINPNIRPDVTAITPHGVFQHQIAPPSDKLSRIQQEPELNGTFQVNVQPRELDSQHDLVKADPPSVNQVANTYQGIPEAVGSSTPDTTNQVRGVNASVPPIIERELTTNLNNSNDPNEYNDSTVLQQPSTKPDENASAEKILRNISAGGARRLTERYHASRSQLAYLVDTFERDPTPDAQNLKVISQTIGMPMHNLVLWFKNRRARRKSKNPPPPTKTGRRSYVKSGIYSRVRQKSGDMENDISKQNQDTMLNQKKGAVNDNDFIEDEHHIPNYMNPFDKKREMEDDLYDEPMSKKMRMTGVEELVGDANPCRSWSSDECERRCMQFFVKSTGGCNEEQTTAIREASRQFFISEVQNGLTLTSAMQQLNVSLSILDSIMDQVSTSGHQLCSGSRIILREFVAQIRSGKAASFDNYDVENSPTCMMNLSKADTPKTPVPNVSASPSIPHDTDSAFKEANKTIHHINDQGKEEGSGSEKRENLRTTPTISG